MNDSTVVINGIEYSRDNGEHVFLVPVSMLGDFRASGLPNHSSLHVTELNFNFNDVTVYFSVTNGNPPDRNDNYHIFLLFSIETEHYQEGSRRIHQIANSIAPISSPGFLDNPRIGAEQIEPNASKHYVTYYIADDENTGNIIIKELADQLISTLNNVKPSIRAFLCHSSEDKSIVEQFANRLKSSRSHVWFDKWEIKVGDSIVEKINDGLDTMTHLIIFLSKSSINKPWVKKELSSALMRKLRDNSVKVMPVRIEDVNVPVIISDIKYADCITDLESGISQLLNDLLS